ncbi:MAG TPA: 30S ribosomal protein S7 [Myxococcota bacterium]|jgi:small subunit ribosomal protein S7|nr:30S ribosomal protein S7 [Myxococcota bacterium]
MPRRGQAPKRSVVPDSRYTDVNVARFINHLMTRGKKALAERIVYGAIDLCEERSRRNGLELFEQALRNATPMVEVRPRRVGGATYQVPMEIRAERRNSLAMRWLIRAARARNGRSMIEKLAGELQDTANGQSATTRRKDETFRMAEANKAFAHYRW